MKINFKLIKRIGIFLSVIICIILISTSFEFFEGAYSYSYNNYQIDNWSLYGNGIEPKDKITLPYRVDENKKNNPITIVAKIPVKEIDDPYLLVRTSQQTIIVRLDGKIIYEFDSMIKSRKKSSGAIWRLIKVPEDCYGKEISITYNSTYDETAGIINKVYFGQKNDHILFLVKTSLLSLIVGFTLVIISIFIIMLYYSVGYKYNLEMKEYFYLSIFLSMLAVIVLVESQGLTFMINNFALYYYCEFISLYAIPIYFYKYVYYAYGLKRRFIIKRLIDFHFLIFIVALIGEVTSIYDFFKFQFIFFMIFITTLIITLITAIKELPENKDINRFIIASIMVIAILLVDMILFFIKKEQVVTRILLIAIITVEITLYINIYNKVFSFFKSNIENRYLNNQIQTNIYYYTSIRRADNKLKKLRHDIKNHFVTISYLLENNRIDKAKEYIGELNEYITESGEIINTGNYILDAIITEKKAQALKNNIEFIARINIQPEIKIDSIDWCIIFGNILDNAIEACNRTDDEKKITIDLKTNGSMFIAKITNSFNGVIINNRGYYETVKSDKEYHGIGIRNVKESIDKYNGIYKIDIDKNKFSFSIILNDVC